MTLSLLQVIISTPISWVFWEAYRGPCWLQEPANSTPMLWHPRWSISSSWFSQSGELFKLPSAPLVWSQRDNIEYEYKLLVFVFRDPFSLDSFIHYFSSWLVFSGNGQTQSFWSSLKTVISTSQSGIPGYLFIDLSECLFVLCWKAMILIFLTVFSIFIAIKTFKPKKSIVAKKMSC